MYSSNVVSYLILPAHYDEGCMYSTCSTQKYHTLYIGIPSEES
jgi:hypothetical protein